MFQPFPSVHTFTCLSFWLLSLSLPFYVLKPFLPLFLLRYLFLSIHSSYLLCTQQSEWQSACLVVLLLSDLLVSLFTYLFMCLRLCLSTYLCAYVSVCLFVCRRLCNCLFMCVPPSIYLSIDLCTSISLSFQMCAYLTVSFFYLSSFICCRNQTPLCLCVYGRLFKGAQLVCLCPILALVVFLKSYLPARLVTPVLIPVAL